MEVTLKNKIRFEIIAFYIAVLVFGTIILDRIIMIIARPNLLSYLNYLKSNYYHISGADAKIAYLVLVVQIYYIGVFHLLAIVMAFIVLLNKKYKIYRKELLYAYLIIVAVDILSTMIHYWIKVK